ncbi:hypothetical protein J6590_044840 [Homalodisca vitripennis]|nr:hypothetical protein J6590_044840 [Homalodisca vitripennis]
MPDRVKLLRNVLRSQKLVTDPHGIGNVRSKMYISPRPAFNGFQYMIKTQDLGKSCFCKQCSVANRQPIYDPSLPCGPTVPHNTPHISHFRTDTSLMNTQLTGLEDTSTAGSDECGILVTICPEAPSHKQPLKRFAQHLQVCSFLSLAIVIVLI